MGQNMSAESKNRKKKLRKKEKKKGRMKKLLNWALGFMPSPFGRTTPKRIISEMARFYSENHAHIVCEHEKKKFVPVMTFLAGKGVLELRTVPGKAEDTKMKMTTQLFRRLLIGVFLRFRLMHIEGKSLNGEFSVESIYVPDEDLLMTPYIDVKFDKLPLDAFQPCTEEAGERDLMKIGYIIQHDILSLETELPDDLEQLLALLRSNPFSKRSLIYSHISLKGLKEKLSYYMWMYKRLMYLKKKSPNKYANIMQKIDDDDEDWEDWRDMAVQNKYLARLRPIVGKGEQGGYSSDGKGQCRFYRNSVEHLPNMFDENNANLEQKGRTLSAPAPQQNRGLPATSESAPKRNGTRPEENQPTAQLKPKAKKKGAQLTRNQPTPPGNCTQTAAQWKRAQSAARRSHLAPNQPAAKMHGAQPTSQMNGAPRAQPAAQMNGAPRAQPAAQMNGAPGAQPAAQMNGGPRVQPAAQMNGAPPVAQMIGAPPVAQTKGTQLAPADKEDEGEELDDFHAAIILVDTFPKFLGDLQEAIYEEGELESCVAEGPASDTWQKHSLQVS